MIATKQQRRRNRRRPDAAAPAVPSTVSITTVTAGTNTCTIVFSGPVQYIPPALPSTWIFGTSLRTVLSVLQTTPDTLVLGLSGTVASTQVYAVQGFDPAVRTPQGGYVAAKTGVMV